MSNSTSSVSATLIRAQYGARWAISIATWAIPSAILWVAPIIGWATVAIFLGALVGFSAVTLPPAGAFAIPAIAALVLLWALPELPAVPARAVRALFFIVLVVDLCVPNYFAIAGTGLPWISIRRLATFPLILCIALIVGGSSAARSRIVRRLASAKLITVCIICYFATIFLSFVTSSSPTETISFSTNIILTWFLPFITIIFLIDDERNIEIIVKTIAWCTVFVSICGLIQYKLQHNFFINFLPGPLLEALMENNPTFQEMATTDMMRNGDYRAPSIFDNALPFGQFEAMIVPFGYYLLVHRRRGDQWLGLLVVVSGVLGIITSGSRGAYVGLLAATPAFVALWVLRTVRFKPRSLAPAFVCATAVAGFAALVTLIFTQLRLYRKVIGGSYGDQQSTQARWDQWHMALPHILANPLTGNGAGTGAQVVGYFNPGASHPTLDSMPIALLVEVGVPGLLFFYGSVIFAIVIGARKYPLDSSGRGALAGGLSCSLIAFLVYSTVLSAVDNFTLLFLLLGLTVALLSLDQQPEKEQTLRDARRRARRTLDHDRTAGAPRAGAPPSRALNA